MNEEHLNSPLDNYLSIESLPYLFQSDFYNIDFDKRGFYLDSKGNEYHYSIPEEEYFNLYISGENPDYTVFDSSDESQDDDGVTECNVPYERHIRPDELFKQLANCEFYQSDLQLELSKDVIEDLKNALVVESPICIYDSGWHTKSVLFYDEELRLYKEIVLSKSGNDNWLNQSRYTSGILELIKEP
ncbi:hypothetical protein [Pedobacter sp. Leaf132]|uniref:hypothetical protein n=1 Tax=Pedobacter sp. Leaf132 TaxID=2876557 RepID=UPI001E43142E|nr:hypothetical protein [Pedobacter sp. Leaf132]